VSLENAVQRAAGVCQRCFTQAQKWFRHQAARVCQQRVDRLRLSAGEPADQLDRELSRIACQPMRRETNRIVDRAQLSRIGKQIEIHQQCLHIRATQL
jgi:hypothetical protein